LGRIARAIARARTSCASDAEEVAQEALIRAWRARGSCRTPARPQAWLRQIVINEAARHHERAGPPELTLEDAPELEDPAGASALMDFDVRTAMRQLEPLDRRLVALRYVADQTQPAIASAVGLPEGTVKVRLHRARARLRDALSSDYDPES
jgi:RNA polymerase sigma-70 factor (ECF subfamily)